MKIYGIIGAGGFGKEVMPLVEKMISNKEDKKIFFVVEDCYQTKNRYMNGHEVITLSEFLSYKGDKYYNIAIGKSKERERIKKSIPLNIAKPFSIYSDNFLSLSYNEVGEGAIFCNFTHITSNVKIGRFFHCNIYSYIAHDCIIGDYVTFAPGVKCNGHVVIEDHVYIGTGAIIKDGTENPIIIGKGAVIGMGAVVTKSIPSRTMVVGNPAKEFKK